MVSHVETDTLRSLAVRLDEAGHGERQPLVEGVASLLNCSVQTVYRKLKEIGWTSGRKRRSDRGRLWLDEETAKKAAYMLTKATSATGKRRMTISKVRKIMHESGQGGVDWETGEVSMPAPSTLSRAMRAYGCHPSMLRQGKPHTHMRSLHPNHCWQVDPSLCVLFYLPKGKVKIVDDKALYKNKPHNILKAEKERVWRYVITDHYSGTIYVRYVQAAGESAQGLVDVFLDAISDRGRRDPMHGVPTMLYMDKGSANTSHLFTNLLDRLGVEWAAHAAGNPRATGQVECAQNIVETDFESTLIFQKVRSVEDLQALADNWRQHYNAHVIHTRTGKSRNDVWMTIAEDQLRLAPPLELCRELVATRPRKATVRPDLSISHAIKGYGRNDYDLRLISGVMPQMQVSVVVNPYRAPAVDVTVADLLTGDETVWTIEPVKKDEAGFWEGAAIIGQEYKSQADTKADKALKEFDAMAGPDPKHAAPPQYVNPMADIRPAPEYMPRRGRDLGLDAGRREIKPLEVVEAAMRLKDMVGDDAWGKESYAWLTQHYPQGVPEAELEDIAARLTGPRKINVPLRLVEGL
ncbi:DDE-type integrase/transposase/recombinase [Pseudodesulfovibrio pelocollis]|uniref:DDE-type integrase/transposase/recombinase n=1 Tax=Pseudodesulfovibrio pelocollis TaxID=3051432 RepID=UPI00255A88CA|nr:DDE-type integrase/transposase/recombinase [Pseudodesulfovibrio sp. SB368]